MVQPPTPTATANSKQSPTHGQININPHTNDLFPSVPFTQYSRSSLQQKFMRHAKKAKSMIGRASEPLAYTPWFHWTSLTNHKCKTEMLRISRWKPQSMTPQAGALLSTCSCSHPEILLAHIPLWLLIAELCLLQILLKN